MQVMEQQSWIQRSWTNNNAESFNHVLKAKTEWKQLKLTSDLVASVKSLVEVQLKDVGRSLHGQGNFVLSGPFMHHTVSYNTWQSLPSERRGELFSRFLFDDRVTVEEKRLMVTAHRENDGSEDPPKRISPFTQPLTKGLNDLVTKSTHTLLKLLDLQEEFFDHDPSDWGRLESYKRNQEVARSVKVVNDLAERGVALIQEFNSSLTRNEEQKQFLLQVIEEHRKTISAPIKTAAVERAQSQ